MKFYTYFSVSEMSIIELAQSIKENQQIINIILTIIVGINFELLLENLKGLVIYSNRKQMLSRVIVVITLQYLQISTMQ